MQVVEAGPFEQAAAERGSAIPVKAKMNSNVLSAVLY